MALVANFTRFIKLRSWECSCGDNGTMENMNVNNIVQKNGPAHPELSIDGDHGKK